MGITSIGIVSPGEMGAAIAGKLTTKGLGVYWSSTGRSEKTRERAKRAGMLECSSLESLCKQCELILSVCPPHSAETVATQIANLQYQGIYVDANAIAPATAKTIQRITEQAGAEFIDASIIGPPPGHPSPAYLYLSGRHSAEITDLFSQCSLDIRWLGDEIGKASAIKMCHSAFGKGSLALFFAVLAAAEASDIRNDLLSLWKDKEDDHGLSNRLDENLRRARKSWRFAGEMGEVARTFDLLALPTGFHLAAAEIYERLSDLHGQEAGLDLDRLFSSIFADRP